MKTTLKMFALTMFLGLAAGDAVRAQQFFNQQQPAAATYSVTNSGTVDVELYWINFEGNEQLFHTIRPGQSIDQSTFFGHTWRIRTVGTRELLAQEQISSVAQGRNVLPAGGGSQPNPQPEPDQPKPQPAGDLSAEALDAIQYLNQIRVNPAAFRHLSASLGDADVQARPALKISSALQAAAQRKAQWMADTEQFVHVMTINGQTVGMNQWMREAGYALADYLPNTETNFECLYGDGGFSEAGVGKRAINAFMAEGKDGGHVLPILGRSWWTPCKDIGIGIAKGRNGMTYVSVLVGTYDPFQPEKTGP